MSPQARALQVLFRRRFGQLQDGDKHQGAHQTDAGENSGWVEPEQEYAGQQRPNDVANAPGHAEDPQLLGALLTASLLSDISQRHRPINSCRQTVHQPQQEQLFWGLNQGVKEGDASEKGRAQQQPAAPSPTV